MSRSGEPYSHQYWMAACCALVGSLFFFASAVGLLRLPDFYTRIHAPTKAATMGILFVAIGSISVHARQGFAAILPDGGGGCLEIIRLGQPVGPAPGAARPKLS